MAETPAPVRAVEPITRPFDAEVTLPGSKSYSNRALLVAALARGRSEITQALWSDDTRYMHRALEALGVRVWADEAARAFEVEGVTAAPYEPRSTATGAAAFLTAAVALGQGTYVVDGSPAMRKRPIQPLLDGLRALGVDAESREGTGCPPVVVRAKGIAGGRARMRGDISSQYFSAILLAAPYARHDVEIEVEGALVSAPYITMTLSTMEAFGVSAEREGDRGSASRPSATGAGLRGRPGASAASLSRPPSPAGAWWCRGSAPTRRRATSAWWTCSRGWAARSRWRSTRSRCGVPRSCARWTPTSPGWATWRPRSWPSRPSRTGR
jgi:3-phosphoshikimate 1-carboxyvinyltransferase